MIVIVIVIVMMDDDESDASAVFNGLVGIPLWTGFWSSERFSS